MNGETRRKTREGGIIPLADTARAAVGGENAGTGHSSPPPPQPSRPKRRRKRRPTARIAYTNLELDPGILEAMGRGYLALARKIRRKRGPGKPRSKKIDKAVALYLEGLRGPQIWKQVIPNLKTMSLYRRTREIQCLRSSLNKRLKRMAGTKPV